MISTKKKTGGARDTAGRKRPARTSAPRTANGGTSAHTSPERTAAAKSLVAAATVDAVPDMIPLSMIKPSPTNPRKTFEIDSLTNSIRAVGFRGRIFVRPRAKKGNSARARKGDGPWYWVNVDWYEIVFGERRFRAAKAAGLDSIPVDIADVRDDVLKAIQLVENDERQDLLISERVASYAQFAEEGKTAEQIQALTGRPLGEIRAILMLRRLKPAVLARCDLKPTDPGHLPRNQAEQIARLPGEEMRELAAAHVLAGQSHRYDSKLPKPAPDAEVLSSRQTKEFIHRECQVQLKGAPFSLTVLDLVKGIPTCEACPNRAGNAAKLDEVYKEVRADMCLDPGCYRKKVEAHQSLTIDTLKKEGRKFLPPKEAAKSFNSYDGASLGWNAPYVDLDRPCSDDPKRRTFRTLLNGCLPADKVVIAIDLKGDPHELLPKSAAESLLKQSGKVKVTRTPPTPERKKEIREERLRDQIIRLGEQYVEAAAANLPSSPTIDKLFVEMFGPLIAEFWNETIRKVDSHRKREAEATAKLEGEPVKFEIIETMQPTGAQARGILARLVAHRELYEGLNHDDLIAKTKGNLAHPLFDAVGVDLKRVIEEAEAVVDGKPAPKKPEVRAPIPPLPKTPPTLTNKKTKASAGNGAHRNALETAEEEWWEMKLAMVPKLSVPIAGALSQRGIRTIGDVTEKLTKMAGKDYYVLNFELHPWIKKVFETALSGVDIDSVSLLYAVDAVFDYLNANPQPSLAKGSKVS